MLASAAVRRVLLLAGVALAALFVVGFLTGAIGSALVGGGAGEQETSGFLPVPEVHLSPQVVFGDDGHDEHGLPSGFIVTNTILSSWIATLVLILLFGLATRRTSVVPSGIQNFAEWIVESLYNFVHGMVGPEYARKFFPIIATIFLFVAVNAWLELLPIYQSLGFIDSHGAISTHLLRAAPTDINMPLALALVSFVFVEYWGIRVHGRGYFKEFVRVENLLHGRIFAGLIDIFVGFLEFLSHGIRIVSFTFRLFGNITAGQILLLVIAFLVPFVALLPFYGLEILVGFIQALIFAGLTLGFAAVAVAPHEEANT